MQRSRSPPSHTAEGSGSATCPGPTGRLRNRSCVCAMAGSGSFACLLLRAPLAHRRPCLSTFERLLAQKLHTHTHTHTHTYTHTYTRIHTHTHTHTHFAVEFYERTTEVLTSLSRSLELAPAATASDFLHTIPSRQTFQAKVMMFVTDAYIIERAKWKGKTVWYAVVC